MRVVLLELMVGWIRYFCPSPLNLAAFSGLLNFGFCPCPKGVASLLGLFIFGCRSARPERLLEFGVAYFWRGCLFFLGGGFNFQDPSWGSSWLFSRCR